MDACAPHGNGTLRARKTPLCTRSGSRIDGLDGWTRVKRVKRGEREGETMGSDAQAVINHDHDLPAASDAGAV